MNYIPTPRICLGCLTELQIRPNRTLPVALCDTCAALPVRTLAAQAYHNGHQRAHEAGATRHHAARLSRVQRRALLLDSYHEIGKTCSECLVAKPVLAFSISEGYLDGLAVECRECIKLRTAVLTHKGAENNGMGSAKANKARWLAMRDLLRAGRVPVQGARGPRASARVVLGPEHQALLDKMLQNRLPGFEGYIPESYPITLRSGTTLPDNLAPDALTTTWQGATGSASTAAPVALPDSLPAHLADERS